MLKSVKDLINMLKTLQERYEGHYEIELSLDELKGELYKIREKKRNRFLVETFEDLKIQDINKVLELLENPDLIKEDHGSKKENKKEGSKKTKTKAKRKRKKKSTSN